MFIGNVTEFGGKLDSKFSSEIYRADKIDLTTGYFGASLVKDYSPRLIKVVRSGGTVRILVGMIFHKGANKEQYSALKKLDEKLRSLDAGNKSGVYISRREYHGKLYSIDNKIIIGSSNFSSQGFSSRLECNLVVSGEGEEVKTAKKYINHLFDLTTTEKLNDVDLTQARRKSNNVGGSNLADYAIDYKPLEKYAILGSMDIELRVDNQPCSSLNLFFDNGRKAPSGKYMPRPWYEVEITSCKEDIRNPTYPRVGKDDNGRVIAREFDAYLLGNDNSYKIKMKVGSAYGKALTSAKSVGGRAILGQYIKGELEKDGTLIHNERVTSEVLSKYGRNTIKLMKISDDLYIVDFRKNQNA